MTSKKLTKIIEEDKKYLFQNYGRLEVSFVRGEGSYLYDQDGKAYIDFFSGIAVTLLGHNNKALNAALHRQIDRLTHTSNWFYNREQTEAGMLLSELAFPGKTLFVNSGTEASEAAIKLARRHGLSKSPDRIEIITFSNSFHGRTYGGMSATAQGKIHEGFGPLLPGFVYLPYNDTESLRKELESNPRIAGIMIELVQGEGGIVIADKSFVKELFSLCAKKNVITIVDEVQTGVGRTGKPFGFQHFGITPDIITLAKGLGGGVPIGAIHAKTFLLDLFDKGRHGTTFGGNHLACAAAAAVLKELKKKTFFTNMNKTSAFIFERLKHLKKTTKLVSDVRGLGLHIGVELTRPGMDIVKKALTRGLVINCTAERVIRIMPPLNIPLSVIKSGMKIFEEIIKEEDTAT